MWVYRERCVRFERIIHSICADFAPQRLLFFRHYTMPYPHQSKRRPCVRVKTSRMRVKDLTAICNSEKELLFVILTKSSNSCVLHYRLSVA